MFWFSLNKHFHEYKPHETHSHSFCVSLFDDKYQNSFKVATKTFLTFFRHRKWEPYIYLTLYSVSSPFICTTLSDLSSWIITQIFRDKSSKGQREWRPKVKARSRASSSMFCLNSVFTFKQTLANFAVWPLDTCLSPKCHVGKDL